MALVKPVAVSEVDVAILKQSNAAPACVVDRIDVYPVGSVGGAVVALSRKANTRIKSPATCAGTVTDVVLADADPTRVIAIHYAALSVIVDAANDAVTPAGIDCCVTLRTLPLPVELVLTPVTCNASVAAPATVKMPV